VLLFAVVARGACAVVLVLWCCGGAISWVTSSTESNRVDMYSSPELVPVVHIGVGRLTPHNEFIGGC
jgi:hypothetical protein